MLKWFYLVLSKWHNEAKTRESKFEQSIQLKNQNKTKWNIFSFIDVITHSGDDAMKLLVTSLLFARILQVAWVFLLPRSRLRSRTKKVSYFSLVAHTFFCIESLRIKLALNAFGMWKSIDPKMVNGFIVWFFIYHFEFRRVAYIDSTRYAINSAVQWHLSECLKRRIHMDVFLELLWKLINRRRRIFVCADVSWSQISLTNADLFIIALTKIDISILIDVSALIDSADSSPFITMQIETCSFL